MRLSWRDRFLIRVLRKPITKLLIPTNARLRGIQMAFAEITNVLNDLNDQLAKVSDEIFSKIDELQEALENQGVIPEEVHVILDSLKSKVNALDAIVPDDDEGEDEGEDEGDE